MLTRCGQIYEFLRLTLRPGRFFSFKPFLLSWNSDIMAAMDATENYPSEGSGINRLQESPSYYAQLEPQLE